MSKNETERSNSQGVRADVLADAVAALKRGESIVFPTETLYGLGADALNAAAVEKVFELKGRDPHHPIPVLVADRAMLQTLVAKISPCADRLINWFWPGPLTLVLPAQPGLPPSLVNATGGIGVRQSSHPLAAQLVGALGRPLTATSANPSGREAARTVNEARSYFANSIETFVDGGVLRSKTGSTVIEIAGDTMTIIREGEISAAALRKTLGGKSADD